MKEGIHPEYKESTITCACGNVMKTNSTKGEMKVDICSKCHPFWTGNLRKETTGGKADKFKNSFNLVGLCSINLLQSFLYYRYIL